MQHLPTSSGRLRSVLETRRNIAQLGTGFARGGGGRRLALGHVVGPIRSVGLAALVLCALGCQSEQVDPAELARQEAARLEEERKKQPFLIELPVPLLSETILETESGKSLRCAKPGHWTTTVQSMTARYDDFTGTSTLAVVGGADDDSAAPLAHTPFRLLARRPTLLAKGRPKRVESELLLPEDAKDPWVAARLQRADSGATVDAPPAQRFPSMPAYQYFLIVLAREPQEYAYLNLLDAVRAPYEDEAGPTALHYRVTLADGSQRMPLPPHALAWTSVAYVVWDDAQWEQLDPEQQQALVDWLHWGGRLIVSGPDSLDNLRSSFLAPYLPARATRSRTLTTDDLTDWLAAWGVASDGTTHPPLALARSWAGVELEPVDSERDQALPGSAGLCYERDVGLGSVVATAMPLTERELVDWPGFDSFWNGALLRRPPRRFGLFREEAWSGLRADWAGFSARTFDAHFTTPLRWFARDWGMSANYRPAAPPTPPAGPQGSWAPPNQPPVEEAPPEPERPGGLGAWNEFGPVASAARELLVRAAGVRVPGAGFVLLALAIYLTVLVPLNWMAFHALGRVEWAWAAAPLIAAGGAAAVVHLAQLDIGFVSARTELAVLELQAGHPRGHLTRYQALYTSLTSSYDLAFENAAAVATPFPSDQQFQLRPGDDPAVVALDKSEQSRLRDLAVASASTLMVHSEEMLELEGALRLTRSSRGADQVDNRTGLALLDAMVVRRTQRSDGAWRYEGCWIGELRSGDIRALPWQPVDPQASTPLWTQLRGAASIQLAGETIDLGPLQRLACQFPEDADPLHGRRDEVRLVGRVESALPGVDTDPNASQTAGAALVVAHLEWGPRPSAEPDANTALQVDPERRTRGAEPSVEQLLEDELESDY